MRIRKFVAAIASTGLMSGGLAFAAPTASAADSPNKTTATQAAVNEPVVDLGEIVHGEAEFSADVTEFSKAALKTKSGQKIYLNIQVRPMRPSQIKPGTCRTAPIGKPFFNEMFDPATGNHYYKPWRVQPGDNVFCMGKDGSWRKKSCNNKAKGIFGVPKPPKSKIRVNGVIRDFIAASGEVAGEGELEGHAEAHVVQYDDNGRKICEARARVDGRGWGMFKAWIKVRSRSMTRFAAQASRQVKVKLRSNTKISGTLMGRLRLSIEGNAMAMCDVPPPPPANERPNVNVNAESCVDPGGNDGVANGTVTNFDDEARTADIVLNPGNRRQTKSVPANGSVNFTFTNLAPDTYTVTVTLRETGLSDSDTFTVEECDTPTDTPPQISCTWHPHVFEKGGNVYGWCETIDPDGDTMSLNVEVDEETPYAHISGVVPSDVRWDGTPCPAGTKCWRFTIWGDSPGFARIIATVTAGGKSAVSRGTIEVRKDEF